MAKLVNMDDLIVSAAADILSDPKRFVKCNWAADKNGKAIKIKGSASNFRKANSPEACRWCAEGAIYKVCGDLGLPEKKARQIIDALPFDVQDANDTGGRVLVRSRLLADVKARKAAAAEAC